MPMPAGSNGCGFIWAHRRMASIQAYPKPEYTGWRMILAFGAGALTGLGQAPWSLWWCSLIGLVALALLLDGARRIRRAAAIGWAAGGGYFGLTMFWIVEPFMVDAARHAWMAPFALVGISGGLALFWALGFGLARWLGGARWPALALVATLTLAEMLRSCIFTGFPWGLLAYIWTGAAPMQIASAIGPHGLTFLTLLITSGVYAATALSRAWAVASAGAALTLFVAAMFLTSLHATARPSASPPILRIIQPNAPQHQKWVPEMMPVFFNRALDFSAAEGGPDLIIWPETSIPALLGQAGDRLADMDAAANGIPVVAGIQRRGGEGYHNSLIVLEGGEVGQVYDKYHLVPFGEYIPLGRVAARFGISAFAAQAGFGYAPGAGPQVLDLGPTLGTVLPLICYEAIFPRDVAAAPQRPDWLLQITNDAWFGNFSGPQQHLAQARFRAVEQGLPLVRAANTGISAVIDAHGQVVGSLPLGRAGYLDAALPPALPPTLYSRVGDNPVLVLLIIFMAAFLPFRRSIGD